MNDGFYPAEDVDRLRAENARLLDVIRRIEEVLHPLILVPADPPASPEKGATP